MLRRDARHTDRWVRVSAGNGIELSDSGQCVRPAVFKLRKWKDNFQHWEGHKEEKNHWLLWQSHGPDFSDSTLPMSLIPKVSLIHESKWYLLRGNKQKMEGKKKKRGGWERSWYFMGKITVAGSQYGPLLSLAKTDGKTQKRIFVSICFS